MGYLAVRLVLLAGGAGVHQWDIRLLRFIGLVKVKCSKPSLKHANPETYTVNILEIYYNPLIFITKLSILIQLMRIFVPNHQGKTYWCIHALIWLNLLFYIIATMVVIMTCLPRAKIWDPTTEGHCINVPAALITGAVMNVVSDFSIMILPIVKIWQLKISRKRKIEISVVFATGGL